MALIWTDPRQVLAGVRRHLGLIDVLVAAALTTGNLVALSHLHYRDSVALAVASSMSCTGAVAFRRVAPQAAMVLAVTSVAVYQGVTRDPQGSFVSAALVLVGYMFGRSVLRTGRHVQGLLVLGYALAVFEIAPYFWQPTQPGGIAGTWLTAVVLPTGVGALVERRDRLTRQLSTAAGRLRDEQRIRADRAAAEERNRAARELHDVVAHHLSVMAIQAAAARTVADRPDAATAALRTVTQSGREVLTDLRRITGVLRRSDDQWGSHPPRLDQLDMLIARTRAAGVTTQLRVFGDLRVVPAAIDLAAYRIIQEALTNVVKHAATTTASVKISISANALALAVTNGGADRATLVPRLPTSGQGLIGMRERIDLYGGQLETGHQAGGGYCVRATIPLGAASPARPPHANAATVSAPTHRLRWNAVRQHLDVLLAGAWLIALEVDALTSGYRHGSLGLNMVVVGTMAAIGVWRRRWPLVFVVAVGGLALLLNGGLDTLRAATVTGTYILLVPVFTVAVYESRARAVAGLLVWEAGVITAGSITNAPAAGIAGAAVMAGIVWVAGRVWRSYRHLEMDLAATVSRLETESSQSEQLAVANQRAVIAQDLDRLVTRHVVSMVVQAQAAQSHCSPETIRGAAGVIEVTGRQALAEMREILGVLRVHGVPADLSARPSMDALSDANRADRHHSFATLGRDAG